LSAAIETGVFWRVSKGEFTTEASLLWGGIPVEIQKCILKNAFCAKCNILVEIVDYSVQCVAARISFEFMPKD
jgi:hypothetical protein